MNIRLLSSFALLLLIPGTGLSADAISSLAECQGSIQPVSVEKPPIDPKKTDQFNARCDKAHANKRKVVVRLAGGSETKEVNSLCEGTYTFLKLRHEFYSQDPEICQKAEEARRNNNSPIPERQLQAMVQTAETEMNAMADNMDRDLRRAAQIASEEKNLAQTILDRRSQSGLAAEADINAARSLLNGLSDPKIQSSADRTARVNAALALSEKEVGQSVAAYYELYWFQKQLSPQLTAAREASGKLAAQKAELERRISGLSTPEDKSPREAARTPGTSSSISDDVLKWTPVALPLAMAGLQMSQAKNAANSSMGQLGMPGETIPLSGPRNPAATSLEGGGNSASGADSSSAASKLADEKAPGEVPMGSFFGTGGSEGVGGEDTASLPSQFKGILGASPVFGSPSTGGTPPGGSSGSSGKDKGKLDDLFQAKADSDSTQPAGGGAGLPKYSGGASASSGDASYMKDLFGSTPDLFGKKDETGGPGTIAGRTSDGEFLSGGSASINGGLPGANDERSLFVRVKNLHDRCLKKGCVTNEEGGKL